MALRAAVLTLTPTPTPTPTLTLIPTLTLTLTLTLTRTRCVPETRGVALERLGDLMAREGDARPGDKTE